MVEFEDGLLKSKFTKIPGKTPSVMKRFLTWLLILSLSVVARGQRVGVVLSGGGAKGLYHVGILKALEENNIPIDYISGASMGAIVAGMYAAGD